MAILQIPVASREESFIQETGLDGKTYRLLFRWNARAEAWYLSLSDSEDNLILSSLKLTAGAALLRHSRDTERRPPGELLLIDPSGTITTPGLDELGTKTTLVYLDEEETAVAPDGVVTELGRIIVEAESRIITPAGVAVSGGQWQKAGGTYGADILNGFEHDNGRLIYIGATARTFLIQGTISMEAASAGDTYFIGFSFSGHDPDESHSMQRYIKHAGESGVLMVGGLYELNQNEFFEFWFKKASGSDTVTANNLIITALG